MGYQHKDCDFEGVHKAAAEGDLVKLKELVTKKKTAINKLDKKHRTALHIACAVGHDQVVQFLVDRNANLKCRDDQGQTALMKAVQGNHQTCVSILLENHADPKMRDFEGNTSLHMAASISGVSIARELLNHEANINSYTNIGLTPLIVAVCKDNIDMARFLLKEGAYVNGTDHDNKSPLMFAAEKGHSSMLKLLLQHDASASLQDFRGWSAVEYAMNNGHCPCSNLIKQATHKDDAVNLDYGENGEETSMEWDFTETPSSSDVYEVEENREEEEDPQNQNQEQKENLEDQVRKDTLQLREKELLLLELSQSEWDSTETSSEMSEKLKDKEVLPIEIANEYGEERANSSQSEDSPEISSDEEYSAVKEDPKSQEIEDQNEDQKTEILEEEVHRVTKLLKENELKMDDLQKEKEMLTAQIKKQDRALQAQKLFATERDRALLARKKLATRLDSALEAQRELATERDRALEAQKELATELDRALQAQKELAKVQHEATQEQLAKAHSEKRYRARVEEQQLLKIETLEKAAQEAVMVRGHSEELVLNLQNRTISLEDQLNRGEPKQNTASLSAQEYRALWEKEVKTCSKLGLQVSELEKENRTLALQNEIVKQRARKIVAKNKVADVLLEQEMTVKGQTEARRLHTEGSYLLKMMDLQVQLDKETVRRCQLEKDNCDLHEELMSLQSSLENRQRTEHELQELRTQMEATQIECRQVKERARQELQTTMSQEGKGDGSKDQNEEQKIESLEDEVQRVTQQLKMKKFQIDVLRKEKEMLTAQVKKQDRALQAQKELVTERDTALSAQKELATRLDKALQVQKELATERDRALQAQKELATKRDRALQAQKALATERDTALQSQKELATERDKALQVQKELEDIQEQLAEAQRECQLLRQQLQEVNNKRVTQQKVVTDTQQCFSHRLSKLPSDCEERVQLLEERNKELLSKATELQDKVCMLEDENKKEVSMRQLHPELSETQEKLSKTEASQEVNTQYHNGLEKEKPRILRNEDRLKEKLAESENQCVQTKKRYRARVAEIHSLQIEALEKATQEAVMVRGQSEELVSNLQNRTISLEDQLSRGEPKQNTVSLSAQEYQALWEQEVKTCSKLGLQVSELEKENRTLTLQNKIVKQRARKIVEKNKVADALLEQEMTGKSQTEVRRLHTEGSDLLAMMDLQMQLDKETAWRCQLEKDNCDLHEELMSLQSSLENRQRTDHELCRQVKQRARQELQTTMSQEGKGDGSKDQNEEQKTESLEDEVQRVTPQLKENKFQIDVLRKEKEMLTAQVKGQYKAFSAQKELATERNRVLRPHKELATERDRGLLAQKELATERDRALRVQKELTTERDKAIRAQKRLATERDRAILAQKELATERDRAILAQKELATERDRVLRAQKELATERDRAVRAQKELATERDTALQAQKESVTRLERALRAQKELATERDRALRPQKKLATEMTRNSLKDLQVKLSKETERRCQLERENCDLQEELVSLQRSLESKQRTEHELQELRTQMEVTERECTQVKKKARQEHWNRLEEVKHFLQVNSHLEKMFRQMESKVSQAQSNTFPLSLWCSGARSVFEMIIVKTNMAHSSFESSLSGASEALDLLHIEVDTDLAENRPDREDAACSKNVWRKQRHWERQLAAKKSKRKEEKQRRKLHREQPDGDVDTPQFTKRVSKAITKERLAEAQSTGTRVCVDLSMTHFMSDKEISRLAGQLRRLYGANKKAPRPFHLFLTDLKEDGRLYRECVRMNDGFTNYTMDCTEQSCLDLFPAETIVYLTPDAEQALQSVDPDKVYVLGGLVDESVQKKLSLVRAGEMRVLTARLPIDEHMVKKSNSKNFHSKILAINQVLDILLTFCDVGSWTDAFRLCFPLGKGYVVDPDATNCQHHTSLTQNCLFRS
ncbi:tRNA methyltransferase 10 homolog B [Eucyclogobius newberryi]|uniref:tRNA methyltransferase 10 homolog B n=1 Tax=Eucyclogobius newberryi TaxID=166745 RepID=UPI003B5A40B3